MCPAKQHSAALPIRIAIAEAEAIAQRAWRGKLEPAQRMLTYFPLMGVVFELHALAGPAKYFQGQRYYVAVDRCSATPLVTHWDTTELLQNIPTPDAPELVSIHQTLPEQIQLRITEKEAIDIAHRAVATLLLRKFKLASQFQLRCVEVIWPFWKPNWLFALSSVRALVDALNGNVVFQR